MTLSKARFVIGNWKMNSLRADGVALAATLAAQQDSFPMHTHVVVCPPFTLLGDVVKTGLVVGGQDCSAHEKGTHTGDISAAMLADCGARYVILGHSDRRENHGETSALIAQKAQQAAANNLVPIICVGETAQQRALGHSVAVVVQQITQSIPAGLADFIIAYEPIWAISSGAGSNSVPASVDDVTEMHAVLRQVLDEAGHTKTPLLYGGSVRADNAASLFAVPHVNGFLVGGASLKAEEFLAIIGHSG